MADVLHMAVNPRLVLQVGGVEYQIEFPLAAVAKAEKKIGKPLRSPSAWYSADATDVPALLEAGLGKHHPEITPEDIAAICDCMNPENLADTISALGALAFPRWTAQFEDNLRRLAEKGGNPKPKRTERGRPLEDAPREWVDLWALCRREHGLTWDEFETLTLAQFEALEERRNIDIRHKRFNAALVASVLINANRTSDAEPVSPFDFLAGFDTGPGEAEKASCASR